LTDAVRKARELRRLGKAETVTIYLAPGTYTLNEPLRLRPEDSGLTISGEGAIISGGMPITGWKRQGKLLVADVPDFNGRPIDFRQLWVNGRKAVRARDVSDFEQMYRIRANDKKRQTLWVPKEAVAPLLQGGKLRADSRYAELVLHEMWCVANLRIKDITLSYNLPTNFVKQIGLNGVKVYASALNLYTFHDVDWWDPERGVTGMGYGVYPMTKSIVGGIEVSF
jgi:hypothetical protein